MEKNKKETGADRMRRNARKKVLGFGGVSSGRRGIPRKKAGRGGKRGRR